MSPALNESTLKVVTRSKYTMGSFYPGLQHTTGNQTSQTKCLIVNALRVQVDRVEQQDPLDRRYVSEHLQTFIRGRAGERGKFDLVHQTISPHVRVGSGDEPS